MKDIQIPVAFCFDCDDSVPVVVEEIDPSQWAGDDSEKIAGKLTVVYCPGCENILNLAGQIDIKWYTPEELEKATGWRLRGSRNN